jgi:hypothetical protein
MGERLQELKADGESAVLAMIGPLAQPDLAIAERLHAIIEAKRQPSRRKTW